MDLEALGPEKNSEAAKSLALRCEIGFLVGICIFATRSWATETGILSRG